MNLNATRKLITLTYYTFSNFEKDFLKVNTFTLSDEKYIRPEIGVRDISSYVTQVRVIYIYI
jgi:hypothetical protein